MKTIDVFQLEHINKTELDKAEGCFGDVKLLGFYRSREKCIEVQKTFIKQPGFREAPKAFKIKRYRLKIQDDIQVTYVYRLTHEYSDSEFDYETNFGIYATEDDAIKKRDQLISKIGSVYLGKEEGFSIDKCILDKQEWVEGYGDIDE